MNELINNEITMTSLEVVELVNKLRLEEGNDKKKEHKTFMRDIRKEIEDLANAGVEGEHNFVPSSYINSQNKEQPCYKMNKAGIMQMLNRESAYVRYKTQLYIEALENKLKEQQVQLSRKQELQLKLFSNDSMEVVNAHKKLVQMEVDEATKPLLNKIEENKPLVDFAETIACNSDSIEIGTFSKLLKDENIKMGRNKLYEYLRENKYLMKNNQPYQQYIDNGYFEIIEYSVNTPYGSKLVIKTLITGKGQIKILQNIKERENKRIND